METIPDEIVEDILSMLPGKELLRFRCVSKSWCAIVDDPRFLKKHHQRQFAMLKEQGDIPLLLDNSEYILDRRCVRHYILSSKRRGDVLLYVTPDLRRDSAPALSRKNKKHFTEVHFYGCVVGVVLLMWSHSRLGLWNPTTRDFMVVPSRMPRLSEEYFCGSSTLGFDPKSDDFKIVRSIVRSHDFQEYSYEMYSLNTNSWKSIENPYSSNIIDYCGTDSGVYINNVHYWLYFKYIQSYLILSFDFCNEMFQQVLHPPLIREGTYYCSLGNYSGSLALIYFFTIPNNSIDPSAGPPRVNETQTIERIETWVMTKVDDQQNPPYSWQHLFTTGSFPHNVITFCSFRAGNEMLINTRMYIKARSSDYSDLEDDQEDVASCVYDLTSKKITKRFGLTIGLCYEYVESLFKLSNRI